MQPAEPDLIAKLIDFAHIEVESHDLEPWAEILRWLVDEGEVDTDTACWLVKGYNAFDGLGAAFGMAARWPTPTDWADATDDEKATIIDLPCTQERRGLRGGRVAKHYDSYVGLLAGQDQRDWLMAGASSFEALCAYMRAVWGCGRQTAFEWAEFAAKVLDVPVLAGHAQLWESEGPRRSLQRLYGNDHPTAAWLDEAAADLFDRLAEAGVPLSWEDFETVICDFNVMRSGRYYPGRHLAALREEINEVQHHHWFKRLDRAWWSVVPEPWCGIEAGIDKTMLPQFRDTGSIVLPFG